MEQNKREKVIKGLECCAVGAECDHCPYSKLNIGGFEGCYQMHQDAIALLKAQEPRVGLTDGYRPIISNGETKYYQCEICLQPIDVGDNYCRHCGRAVKWDG